MLWFAPSVVTMMGEGQVATGALPGLQTKETVAGELIHPLEFGAGETEPMIVGPVSEIFTVTWVVSLLPAASTAVPLTT
jgi:hypothetical protein